MESLLRSQSVGRDVELKTALARLSKEIRARLVRGSDSSIDFIESSVRALVRLKGGANAVLRMDCLCDSGQYLFSNGRTSEALVAGIHCESLARHSGNKDFLSKAQTLQAMANSELGNVAQAVIQCVSALHIAVEIGHIVRQASVLINLGIAFKYAGLYGEAIPCFDKVAALMRSPRGLEEAQKLGPLGREFSLAALSNKSQSLYEMGRFEEGFASIDQCLSQAGEPWDAVSSERRSIREFTFVQCALELGKLAAAREHARRCAYYGLGANQRADFHSKVAAALCEVHGGDAERGIAAAKHDAGLSALLAIGHFENTEYVASTDLGTLTVREANLRAKVAERKLVAERIDMFERFAVTADLKEELSGQHGYRVGRLAALIAERIEWKRTMATELELAARLHDIGKVAIPDRILRSPDTLQESDRKFMTAHTLIGSELLSKSALPQLRLAERIARHHHEWWDGTGYPSKLSGKRIPIHARIVALADVFDALTHGRPYAPAWPIDKALEEIKLRRGTQFDPDLTDAFLALIDDLRREHANLDAFLGEASRNSPFLQARDKIRLMLEGERHAENLAAAAAETVH